MYGLTSVRPPAQSQAAGSSAKGDAPAQNSADMLQTNLVSPMVLSQMVIADIIQNNKNDQERPFGHICNIGSVIAYLLVPGQTTYGVTKAGMLAFGSSLALELDRYPDVTITDVLPGAVIIHAVGQ